MGLLLRRCSVSASWINQHIIHSSGTLTYTLLETEGKIFLPPKAASFHCWPVEIVRKLFPNPCWCLYPSYLLAVPPCISLEQGQSSCPRTGLQIFGDCYIFSQPSLIQVNSFWETWSRNTTVFAFDDCAHKTASWICKWPLFLFSRTAAYILPGWGLHTFAFSPSLSCPGKGPGSSSEVPENYAFGHSPFQLRFLGSS